MQANKRPLIAGIILFLGVAAVVLVVVYMIRLYTAMPSKIEVINFANNMSNTLTEDDGTIVGSLVPDSGEDTLETSTVLPTSVPQSDTPRADWLSPEQRRTLARLGIDESKLPATLTPELEACFVKAIGEVRVEAIKAGDSPTVVEGLKAITCL